MKGDLGRLEIGVAEQILDGYRVGSPLNQTIPKGIPQIMESQVLD
jgi:hypothetical protein